MGHERLLHPDSDMFTRQKKIDDDIVSFYIEDMIFYSKILLIKILN